MATAPTPITALSTPPSRSDPTTFAARGDTFLGELPGFATETNAVATNVYSNAVDALNQATNAAASSSSAYSYSQAAAASASAAAAASGAVLWVSGTTYAIGDVVWSPTTYLSYRRKTAGAGTTDPSTDGTNWALIGAPASLPTQVIATNTTAVASTHYIFTASLALLLPLAPSIGTVVRFTDLSGTTTSSINPNGEKIRGATGTMLLNIAFAEATLEYTGSTLGWV